MDLLIKRVAASSGLTEKEVEAGVDALWRAGLPYDEEDAILKAIRRQQPEATGEFHLSCNKELCLTLEAVTRDRANLATCLSKAHRLAHSL